MKPRTVISLILVALVVLFTLQNMEAVTITVLFWQFSLSRAFLIFTVLAIGIIVGFLARPRWQ